MMYNERLMLLKTMLTEVVAGDWKITAVTPPLKTRAIDTTVSGNIEFNLDSWICQRESESCGFSACAVGHLVLDKRFTDLGWSFDGQSPVYRGENRDYCAVNWDAVELFFGLHSRTAERLFSSWEYRDVDGNQITATPQDVINRIDMLLNLGVDGFNHTIAAENSAKQELKRAAKAAEEKVM